jgi:chemotaxis receptor (MCP) glutamine deamidase CheD
MQVKPIASVSVVGIVLYDSYHKYCTLKFVLCVILRACVAKTLRDLHQNFGAISVVFLSASDGAGAAWVAIGLAACEFKRFQARCTAGL